VITSGEACDRSAVPMATLQSPPLGQGSRLPRRPWGEARLAISVTLRGAAWARIGVAEVVASIAVYAAVEVVDGVSNRVMIHRWAVASGEARMLAYEAAICGATD